MTQETPNPLLEGLSGLDVIQLVTNLRAILSDLNPEKAMADARETAAILDRAIASAERINASAERVTARAERITAKADQMIANAERAIADAERSAANAKKAAANAERAADANERSTDALVARLEAMGYGDGGNGTRPTGYGDSRDQGE